MSRRLSVQAKHEQRKPRVRFPDELVFLDNIRENDLSACNAMLRKASLSIDINGINDAGESSSWLLRLWLLLSVFFLALR